MSTITATQQEDISNFLKDRHIPYGLGTKKEACSIAAINLALSGELTDKIPSCMSPVIGRWIIGIQDAMPDSMRNSREWRELLPMAAGTGREHEPQRSAILMNWVWDVVLPELQPIADAGNFGPQWKKMTGHKTAAAAATAAARYAAAARYDAAAAAAATAAAAAAAAARYDAADAAGYAAAAADAAGYAAAAADAAADAAAAFWTKVNPIATLIALIDVSL